jgi:hypothetical protein
MSATVHQEFNTSMPVVVGSNLRSKIRHDTAIMKTISVCLILTNRHKKSPHKRAFCYMLFTIVFMNFRNASEYARHVLSAS